MLEPKKPIAIIEAPLNLGLMPPDEGPEPGTRGAPATLRGLGLHRIVNAQRTVTVEPPPYDPDSGRLVNIRNIDAIRSYSIALADAIDSARADGFFPLILGGDCSILIGSMLCMKRSLEPRLLFVDGHTDFYLPEQSGTGGAAGMDLALVSGWGPDALCNIEDRGPYVRHEHIAALGNRDHEPRRAAAIPPIWESGIHYRSLDDIRNEGVDNTTRAALKSISPRGEEFWIHLDVDVVDSRLMPAVDSPQQDGLTWQELKTMLEIALTGNAAGLQITIYDPTRDAGFSAGRKLVSLLASVLTRGDSIF